MVEVVDGIQFLVSQKLPHVAVDLVCARLDDGVHDGAIAAAEFRAVGVGFDFELGDGIHRGLDHIGRAVKHVAKIGVVVDAVEQEIVLQRAGAVGAEAVCRLDARSRLSGGNAGTEQSELSVIASVQRKRVDALAIYHLAQFGGFGFELRTLAGDGHDFGCHAGLKVADRRRRDPEC